VVQRANSIEVGQLIVLENFHFRFHVSRTVIFSEQFGHALRLEERHHAGEFVEDRSRRELLPVAEEGAETPQIDPLDLLHALLIAGLLEVGEGHFVALPRFVLP
jgi:hypothetical protein